MRYRGGALIRYNVDMDREFVTREEWERYHVRLEDRVDQMHQSNEAKIAKLTSWIIALFIALIANLVGMVLHSIGKFP